MSHGAKLPPPEPGEWRSHRDGKRGDAYWRRGDGAQVRRIGRRWSPMPPHDARIPPQRTAVTAMSRVSHAFPVPGDAHE